MGHAKKPPGQHDVDKRHGFLKGLPDTGKGFQDRTGRKALTAKRQCGHPIKILERSNIAKFRKE